ncbi:hypothetical protein PUR49_01995 [Streptomyces sp. BE147]|uniref:hypothetical protein n=1 Tax=Streptomyces sp. BE147 TaxID=3002524 RepID=UPI002E77BEAE|nr:hypothetical protein [Streptomyces sp. BE147]MEE1735318.1 hypothetical protein [Streptomyces sp. BE147]
MAIVKKHGEPWIRVSPRGKQEEPESLVSIKGETERRWGTIDLNSRLDLDLVAVSAVPGPRSPQEAAAPAPA